MAGDLTALQRLQLESERRAIPRGLEDLIEDTGFERKYARQDARITRRDLAQALRRGRQDIQLDKRRGLRQVGQEREDVRTDASRGREDFGTALTNLITDFGIRARQQEQSAAAAGVTGGTFGAASAAARQAQFERQRQPIDTGLERLGEDTTTALGRLTAAAGDIRKDSRISGRRLGQDVRADRRLARIDLGRTLQGTTTSRQRGRREAVIGQAEITKQIAALRR